jgi:hypothetical protein
MIKVGQIRLTESLSSHDKYLAVPISRVTDEPTPNVRINSCAVFVRRGGAGVDITIDGVSRPESQIGAFTFDKIARSTDALLSFEQVEGDRAIV